MINLKVIYRLPTGIGIIGNSRYIRTCFSGLIQEVKLKEKNHIQLLQRNIRLINMIERLIVLAIKN